MRVPISRACLLSLLVLMVAIPSGCVVQLVDMRPLTDARINPASRQVALDASRLPESAWFFEQHVKIEGHSPASIHFGVIAEWMHESSGRRLYLPSAAYTSGHAFKRPYTDDSGASRSGTYGYNAPGMYSPLQDTMIWAGRTMEAPYSEKLQALSEWSYVECSGNSFQWHGAGGTHPSAGLWDVVSTTCFAAPILALQLFPSPSSEVELSSTLPWLKFSGASVVSDNGWHSIMLGTHTFRWRNDSILKDQIEFEYVVTLEAPYSDLGLRASGSLKFSRIPASALPLYIRSDGQNFAAIGQFEREAAGPMGNTETAKLKLELLRNRASTLGLTGYDEPPELRYISPSADMPADYVVPLQKSVTAIDARFRGLYESLGILDRREFLALPVLMSQAETGTRGMGDSATNTVWLRAGLEWDIHLLAHELAHCICSPPTPSELPHTIEGLATWWAAEEAFVDAVARRMLGWPLDYGMWIGEDLTTDLIFTTLGLAYRQGPLSQSAVYESPKLWNADGPRSNSTYRLMFGTADYTGDVGALAVATALFHCVWRHEAWEDLLLSDLVKAAKSYRGDRVTIDGGAKWTWEVDFFESDLPSSARDMLLRIRKGAKFREPSDTGLVTLVVQQ